MSQTDARAAREALERLLEADPPALPPRFADAVERYVELLLEANRHLNLTRVVEPDAVARLHLLDALAALPLIDAWQAQRAVDLGAGGGVPGIVLALARPEMTWTLVDSVGRKVDAMRSFVNALGLRSVTVVAARAEDLGRDTGHRELHDLVTARAVAALPVLAEYALPLARIGGRMLAWKGPIAAAELAAGRAAAARLGAGDASVRETGYEALGVHRFVVVTKERSTPDAYPRRPGVPTRQPLA